MTLRSRQLMRALSLTQRSPIPARPTSSARSAPRPRPRPSRSATVMRVGASPGRVDHNAATRDRRARSAMSMSPIAAPATARPTNTPQPLGCMSGTRGHRRAFRRRASSPPRVLTARPRRRASWSPSRVLAAARSDRRRAFRSPPRVQVAAARSGRRASWSPPRPGRARLRCARCPAALPPRVLAAPAASPPRVLAACGCAANIVSGAGPTRGRSRVLRQRGVRAGACSAPYAR
jgi:hypothetical protein